MRQAQIFTILFFASLLAVPTMGGARPSRPAGPAAALLGASLLAGGPDIRDEFARRNAGESLPRDSRSVRWIKFRSELLSRFHGHPVYLRAGLLLPADFDRPTERRYPLWIRMGGFGTRYTYARESANELGWPFESEPQFLILWLDGDGPYGDPSQVNSDNNGPYGDALTQELIPYVERTFRGIGKPHARFLQGTSTGGWASLALQVFYPGLFNGAYAFWPDPVDFRAFETINIYQDGNAYRDAEGRSRAGQRNRGGRVIRTILAQCSAENYAGGGSYTLSGEQWGAWNAIFSPRGTDGHPVPLWHPRTGEIDRSAAEQWKRYDLRLVMERDWARLGPQLRGKINVWVGEQDAYFLNDAVHLLHQFLSRASPPADARIVFDPGGGHGGFRTLRSREMMVEMAARVRAAEGG